MPLAEQSLSEGFHQMFSDVVTHGHQLMNVDPRRDILHQRVTPLNDTEVGRAAAA